MSFFDITRPTITPDKCKHQRLQPRKCIDCGTDVPIPQSPLVSASAVAVSLSAGIWEVWVGPYAKGYAADLPSAIQNALKAWTRINITG